MSLYSEYLKERTYDELLESEQGFASYRYLDDGKTVYIVDIFVRKPYRKTGYAAGMADIIAKVSKDKGAKKMIGSVVPSTKGSTDSLRVLLGYGMKLDSSTNDFILFSKEL